MNLTIEMIERARAIYQNKYGGDYMANGEVFKRITFALREAIQEAAQAGYCMCKLSVLHENNICVNCGLPYKHLRDAPFTVFDVPRPWSTDDMKEYCSCGEDCVPMLGDNTCVRCDLEIKKVAE